MRVVAGGTVFVLFLVGAGAVAFFAYRFEHKRRAAAVALAHQHGFEIDVKPKKPPPHDFDVFDHGSRRLVSYQIWRRGAEGSAFQYQYTVSSGKNSTTYRFSCALVATPFHAPHLRIGTEGFFSALGRMVGLRDIEVESPQFNERYRVRCDDERFAITLLDPAMIGWMLNPTSSADSVRYEFLGPWMLVVADPMPFERLFGFLDWAEHALDQTPDVLASLYPRR
jgi:hypothetical protein